MVGWFVNGEKAPSGSWLDRWLPARKQHPLVFTCGVRVVSGEVPGLTTRWRYRDSALDRLPVPGQVVVQYGSNVTLRLEAVSLGPAVRTRPNHVVLSARDVATGAALELSVPNGEAISFGVELI